LARYDDLTDKPPAIVRRICGKGKVVLCGVHPEFDGWKKLALSNSNPAFQELHQHEPFRRKVFKKIIKSLGFPCANKYNDPQEIDLSKVEFC
jgi:glutamine amidotransferase-like uncharacterized protein